MQLPSSPIPCAVCGREFAADALVASDLLPSATLELIQADHPNWTMASAICTHDLARYRARQAERLIEEELGELTDLEREVVHVLEKQTLVASNTEREIAERRTFGERVADRIARFGGSWGFILSFIGFLVIWIVINTIALFYRPFDPFPFILLNLILSCVAALQAPVIMMSQNRQEAKDRLRAENDYQVNLKAELEIRLLSARVDRLLHHQWRRLIELQQIQVDLIRELGRDRDAKR
jgi:uncharacterized membrane protein